MFVRTENFNSFIRFYPIVSLIVAVHFILWLFSYHIPGGTIILERMAGVNYWIEQGEYWRLITPIFLHGGFGHVLFNSFSLVLFGPALEKIVGKRKFLFTYLGAGLIANIFTYFLEGPMFSHVGASGAIFGLFGVYVYMVIYRKDLIDSSNAQVVMTILIIGIVMSFTRSNINILAHIFGLIGGAALAPIVLRNTRGHHLNMYTHRRSRSWRLPRLRPHSIIWFVLGILVIIGIISRML